MKKVIYVLSLYDCSGTVACYESCDILSAYDSVEEAEKGLLNYYNNYIVPNNMGLSFANTIEEVQEYLDNIDIAYSIIDTHYYTK